MQFVWVKGGKVFDRIEEKENTIRITSQEKLDKLENKLNALGEDKGIENDKEVIANYVLITKQNPTDKDSLGK